MLFGSDQNENVTADCERRKIKSENASGDHGEFLRGIQNFGGKFSFGIIVSGLKFFCETNSKSMKG